MRMSVSMEQAFESALDESPFDGATRLAYADWLRDNGRDDEADLQQWLAARRKAPRWEEDKDSVRFWGWLHPTAVDKRTYAKLPLKVSEAINKRESSGRHYPYPSRREAELGLLAVLDVIRGLRR
jgi:uncharacterized protein (TIGR02996 family)